jgi:hypothetical protein
MVNKDGGTCTRNCFNAGCRGRSSEEVRELTEELGVDSCSGEANSRYPERLEEKEAKEKMERRSEEEWWTLQQWSHTNLLSPGTCRMIITCYKD